MWTVNDECRLFGLNVDDLLILDLDMAGTI